MTILKKFPLVAFLISFQFLPAQEIGFGEVTKEELLEKEHPLEKDAHAAILYRDQNTYYLSGQGYANLVTEVHERIKIYSKDGFEHATEFINLYSTRSDEESVSKIVAYTYNLENGQIVKSKLEKDQIFKTELSYNYNQAKFTMPNVKEGSVIEFKYKITSPFIWNIDDFRFQHSIPVKRLHAQIRTPKGFNFKQTHKGFLLFTPKTVTRKDHRVGMDMVIKTYDLTDVPSLKEESYVDNINNYRAGVMFELVSINIPGSVYKSYAQTWSDVAKTIGSSSAYKNELDKTRSFDDELDLLLTGKTNKLEITKLLFDHVKNTTEWNGVDGKYFQHGLKKTLKEKKGNAADINLLLVAMLRYAGVKANPVVISTKDNAFPFFPTLERLNYVIAHAKIGDKQYFMDATEEFSDLNLLPIKDYNWKGLLVDNENMVWSHIDVISPKKATNTYLLTAELSTDGTLGGKCQTRLTNHTAYSFREKFKNKSLEEFLADKESKLSGIEISNYEAKNADTYKGPISETFDFNFEGGADVINDKIYMSPLSFLRMEENPFKAETREYPIDFGYAFGDKYMLNITIPEGYEVESIPETIVLRLPENLGEFKYIAGQKDNRIQLSINFEVNKAMIGPQNYPFLKEYFNQVITKEAEQIVLAKVTENGNKERASGSR
ncbi:MAG: DUF3857 domain-containing protein [Aurantibacter sp.]